MWRSVEAEAPPSDASAAALARIPAYRSCSPTGCVAYFQVSIVPLFLRPRRKEKPPAFRGEGSAVGLQLRVRFAPAALLAMLRTALPLTRRGQYVLGSDRAGGERPPQGLCQLDRPLKWPVGPPEAGGGSFRVSTGDPHPIDQC
jgi:hypothetical protein